MLGYPPRALGRRCLFVAIEVTGYSEKIEKKIQAYKRTTVKDLL